MYRPDNIFHVLPIKNLEKQDSEPTKPHKLATGKKPRVSHLSILLYMCAVRKATAHVEKKAFYMRHQSQKGF